MVDDPWSTTPARGSRQRATMAGAARTARIAAALASSTTTRARTGPSRAASSPHPNFPATPPARVSTTANPASATGACLWSIRKATKTRNASCTARSSSAMTASTAKPNRRRIPQSAPRGEGRRRAEGSGAPARTARSRKTRPTPAASATAPYPAATRGHAAPAPSRVVRSPVKRSLPASPLELYAPRAVRRAGPENVPLTSDEHRECWKAAPQPARQSPRRRPGKPPAIDTAR